MTHRNRQLVVSALARVEGEGALDIVVADGEVREAPSCGSTSRPGSSRRSCAAAQFTEVTDITSRICGICPVAYQTSRLAGHRGRLRRSASAPPIAALRRLLYCGEWISSHALHIYLLHAPDFLGYPDVVAMARDHRAMAERGLALKKAGNAILEAVGGRAIHPVNPRVGGFYRAPTAAELAGAGRALERALDDAMATAAWVAGFSYPDAEISGDLLAVHDPDRYPIEGDQVATTSGLVFPAADFPRHVTEHQVPHSTALHATLDGGMYLTGPLARYALAAGRLTPAARRRPPPPAWARSAATRSAASRSARWRSSTRWRKRCASSRRTSAPDPSFVPAEPAAGTGHGVSEAPRGLLYHRYRLAADGTVEAAVIIPPTSQNQAAIEADLRRRGRPPTWTWTTPR